MPEMTSTRAVNKLFAAIDERDSGAVREMLAAGVPANVMNKDGHPAIVRAAISGDSRSVAMLLDAGADPNQPAKVKRTPNWSYALTAASSMWNRSVIEVLLERGADPDLATPEGKTAADYLVESTRKLDTPCGEKFLERTLASMVANGLSLNRFDEDRKPFLVTAIRYRAPLSVIKMLLKHNADPNIGNGKRLISPIYSAIAAMRPDVLQLLIRAGGDIHKPDEHGQTALFHYYDEATAAVVFASNPDLDHQDFSGDTALHHRLSSHAPFKKGEKSQEVADLVTAGANPSIANKRGEVPMDIIKKRKLSGCAGIVSAAIARNAVKSVQARAKAKLGP